MNKRRLAGAAAAAFGAQGVTVAVSALTLLVIAGGLSASEYGLWQLYLLVGSYGGLLHLGLCDGVYLRLGGADYNALDMSAEGTVFRRASLIQTVPILIAAAVIAMSGMGAQRISAIILALIYIPLFNAAAYLGCILQATDKTVSYSASVVIDRLVFALWVGISVIVGTKSFVTFALGSIVSKTAALVYCIFRLRTLVFAPGIWGVWSRARRDISSGARLMIANLAGQLVTGAARFAVIYGYGDAEFGRISLVMTLSSLFLQFTSQLGMVLFPSLRRTDSASCHRAFFRMERAVGVILPAVFFAYLPFKCAINVFLPDYSSAAEYLILLLPLCFLYGKTQLVGTMYLKVQGKVGRLMALNLVSALLSMGLCFGAAYADSGVWSILLAATVSAFIRSAMFDRVCHHGEGEWHYQTVAELLLCVAFAVSAAIFANGVAVLVYAASYILYILARSGKLKYYYEKHKA